MGDFSHPQSILWRILIGECVFQTLHGGPVAVCEVHAGRGVPVGSSPCLLEAGLCRVHALEGGGVVGLHHALHGPVGGLYALDGRVLLLHGEVVG